MFIFFSSMVERRAKMIWEDLLSLILVIELLDQVSMKLKFSWK